MSDRPQPPTVHPYIPNSIPEVRAAMLEAVDADSVEEFYSEIPDRLRLHQPLDLPPALSSESELSRHVSGLIDRNPSMVSTVRKVAVMAFTIWVVLWIVLTLIGFAFRGPNWGWVWPWDEWHGEL